MPIKSIIPGQKIIPEKLQLARELRREMTPTERVLWQALRGNKLAGLHFRRQQIIAGFIVDFFCHEADLVLEMDGGIHQEQQQGDAERDAVLAKLGLRVMRLPNEEVLNNLPQALEKILIACGK